MKILLFLLLICLTGCSDRLQRVDTSSRLFCHFEEVCPTISCNVDKIELRVLHEPSSEIYYYEEIEYIDQILTYLNEQTYQVISRQYAMHLERYESRAGDPTYQLLFYREDTVTELSVNYQFLQVNGGAYYLCDELWEYMDELESWDVPNEPYDWRMQGTIEDIP